MIDLNRIFSQPLLTPVRRRGAYAIAIATDVVQMALGPFGWTFVDQALDVAAAIAISRLIGFHPLLLPTFVLELVPIADMLPTWTGCVALVVALRKREPVTAPSDPRDVIDI